MASQGCRMEGRRGRHGGGFPVQQIGQHEISSQLALTLEAISSHLPKKKPGLAALLEGAPRPLEGASDAPFAG